MTGYGDAECTDNGVSYTLEIRSLNNRYFKTTIKLPDIFQFLEPEVEKLLRAKLGRGSITYTLRFRDTRPDAAGDVNQAALQAYVSQIAGIQADNVQLTVDLGALLALPGIVQPKESNEATREQQGRLVRKLSDQAIDKLLDMRRLEGKSLYEDLLKHTVMVRECIDKIEERAPYVVEAYNDRLRQRVDALIKKAKLQLDEESLIKEVAIFAERCDINEEISRARSHLDQFDQLCASNEHAGRKLDFLSQELLREANTIGSKANDGEIAKQTVNIKGYIDRLKEQVQNVE
jgi:uncharacterized protein (TIGR00255 family)